MREVNEILFEIQFDDERRILTMKLERADLFFEEEKMAETVK
jgi:hypothetical protein